MSCSAITKVEGLFNWPRDEKSGTTIFDSSLIPIGKGLPRIDYQFIVALFNEILTGLDGMMADDSTLK